MDRAFLNQELKFNYDFQTEHNLIDFYLELAELNSNLDNIFELIKEMDSSKTEAEFLMFLLKKLLYLIPEADYGRIYLIDELGGYFLKTVYKENFNFESEFETKNNSFNSAAINFKKNYNSKKISVKLKIANQLLGAVVLYTADDSRSYFTENSKTTASALEKLASFYLKGKRYKKLQQKFTEKIIYSLTNLLEIHDPYTKGHNQNVADLSKKIALKMGLTEQEAQKAYWTGILHDIAKTIIPVEILNKKGPLSEKEFTQIKKHPLWAYKILKDTPALKEIAEYILYHHERWDGSGYPAGLKSTEIPLISRIIALADAWDAMQSDRSYRCSLSRKKAVEQIIKNRGKQFDPELVDIFLKKL